MHIVALIMGARGATTEGTIVKVPVIGVVFAGAVGAAIMSGLMYSWTWQSRVNQPVATVAASPTASHAEAAIQNPAPPLEGKAVKEQRGQSNTPPVREWIGHWEGVEGTSLELSQKVDGDLLVKINSLDGEMSVRGVIKGNVIEFYHLGQRKVIRFGNGDETGMIWLVGKTECLILAEGEGYCRK